MYEPLPPDVRGLAADAVKAAPDSAPFAAVNFLLCSKRAYIYRRAKNKKNEKLNFIKIGRKIVKKTENGW